MSCLATSTSEKLLLDAVLVLQLCCGLEATYLSTYSLEAGYRVVVHTTSLPTWTKTHLRNLEAVEVFAWRGPYVLTFTSATNLYFCSLST